MVTGAKVAVAGVGLLGLGLGVYFATRKRPAAKKKGKTLEQPGFSLGPDCELVVYNIEKARAAAYQFGLDGPTYDEAKAKLFGGCGKNKKIQLVTPDDARNMYLLGFEVLRGSVDGGYVTKELANAEIADNYVTAKLLGFEDGLPDKLP